MRWLLPLAVLMLSVTACQPYQYAGTVLGPPTPLDDFTLPTADGGTFRLSDYRGQKVLVYFGYTSCPDICPTTVLEVRKAVEALGDEAQNVQFVMISVDPARDTPERLQQYMTNFHPSFIGLRTDDEQALDAVLQEFGAYYEIPEQDDEENYLVNHTAALFLVDESGGLREVFSYGVTGEQIAEDIRHLD